ncbi:MAG: LytR/AlgR family response regulator transcription factor [Chitinophagaceae bacterium]
MAIFTKLKQPFPYESSLNRKLGMAAFFGLFIFIFLIVFRPFQLDALPWQRLLLIAFVYGSITFICVFGCTTLLPIIFTNYFNEKSWTAGKQIFFIIAVIFVVGLANFSVSPFFVDTQWDFSNAIWFQGITLAIGLIPVSIFILSQQNRLLKKFSGEAEVIEIRLKEKQDLRVDAEVLGLQTLPKKIIFVGDYQNEKLEIYPDDLYLITSASNYIKIFHLQKDKLIYSIIRSTMKNAEETVQAYPSFFKCHRAFIINLNKVSHVEGNAQGYKIKIDGYDELIPVSRNLNREFSDRLLAFQ